MDKIKFFQAIKKLSVFEVNEFSDLVSSPFFNKNIHVKQLWELVMPHIKNGTQADLSKEELWKNLFDEAYDELKFNNYLSDLYQLLEQYFLQLQLKEHKPLQENLTLQKLNNLHLLKHFKQAQRRQQNYFSTSPADPELLYGNINFFEIADDHYTRQSKKLKEDYLALKMESLDLYFIVQKLKAACEMLNRQQIFNKQYSIDLIEPVIDLIHKKDPIKNHPLVALYLKLYFSFAEPEKEQHFYSLSDLLKEYSNDVNKTVLKDLYNYAQNYCIRKINTGKSKYLKELFSIYKELLRQELLQQETYFSEWDYKNIVTVGIRLKEFQWTGHFIENYHNNLAPAAAENAYIYNLATLYFAEKKFEKAIELLRDVEFTDVVYHLGARVTLLKIYYEKMEEAAFGNLVETFGNYIYRNKLISTPQKKAYKNMLQLAKRIFRLQANKGYYSYEAYQKRYNKIAQKLAAVNNIANINWIKEIMAEAAPVAQN